ncbi:hypothetical protein AMJ82_10930, partial [candidate division TA06 bacterium SM23_40]
MREIDGSYGEGGGQILRTSIALSLIRGVPVTISRVRAGRRRPGLRPQHLACVRAAAEISGAQVEGAEIGSQQVSIVPGPVRPGRYTFDVAEEQGSAGSVALMLQTILPVLPLAGAPSELVLRGGTHVPMSPPAHYVRSVLCPVLALLGARVEVEIRRCGYYPRGGGEIAVRISPSGGLKPLVLGERGALERIVGLSGVTKLPLSIAERQRSEVLRRLEHLGTPVEIDAAELPGRWPGTFVHLAAECERGLGGANALGRPGKRAEQVGDEAAGELLQFLSSSAPVDPHLADQLVVFLALASGASEV